MIPGFENPNYDSLSRKSTPKKDSEPLSDEGVIIVKPVNKKSNSLDTTMTIESVEDISETENADKPKLSPLFGRSNDNSNSTITENVQVELEPRTEFRKLSPIVLNRNMNHIDFKDRPQSSPTYKRNKVEVKRIDSLKETNMTEISLGDGSEIGGNGNGKNMVLINHITQTHMQKEFILTERSKFV